MTVSWCGVLRPVELMTVAVHTVDLARLALLLPQRIEIEFCSGGEHHYWGATVLDPRWCGRMRLNAGLQPREVPLILAHELMHVHQVHTGELRPVSSGGIMWRGVLYTDTANLPWEQYMQLPWEMEAYEWQEWLLAEILRLSTDKDKIE